MIGEALKAALLRGLIVGVSLAVAGYLSLWACAPVATMRAPVAMPDHDSFQVSGGLAVDTATQLPAAPAASCSSCVQGLSVEGYAAFRYRRLELSLLAFAGASSALGGGVGVRGYLLDSDRLQVGLDAQGGWLWVDAGVPIGVRVAEGFWLYSRPNLSLGLFPRAVLPLGAAVALGDHFLITPEVGIFAGPLGSTATPRPNLYGGIGLTLRLGGGDRRTSLLDVEPTPPASSPTPPPPPVAAPPPPPPMAPPPQAGPDAPPPLVSPGP